MGGGRIRQALEETAELLESLVGQTLDLMNAGARLDEAVRTVRAPAHLLARPYLRPVYDEPEFVVRAVWRRRCSTGCAVRRSSPISSSV